MMPVKGNVVLIGLGGIGFRHFQALQNSACVSNLYVIDINEGAIKRAKIEESNSKNDICVHYGCDISILPQKIDVLIIATSSLVRRQIFESVIKRCVIKYVIFEKFLFPALEDYEVVENILKSNNILAYVNCPGRIYEGYKKLKLGISGKPILFIESGSDWGLACNFIHIIDEVSFLIDSNEDIDIDISQIDNKIKESKRSGYIEFTGRIICRVGDKAIIIADSYTSGNVDLKATLFDGKTTYSFSEIAQTIIESDGNSSKEEKFPIFFQSQLTDKIVDGLLTKGECELTRYENTVRWHKSILRAFMEKYDEIEGKKHDICPIT